MCGIIGQIGQGSIIKTIEDGLKYLSYRGYDSYGYCLIDEDNVPIINKCLGEFNTPIETDKTIKIAFGHTRWATHGEPSVENAHPHVSFNNRIYLVHNGIYENTKRLPDSKGLVDDLALCIKYDYQRVDPILRNMPTDAEKIIAWNEFIAGVRGNNAVVFWSLDFPDRLFYFTTGTGTLFVNSNAICSDKIDDHSQKVKAGELHWIDMSNRFHIMTDRACGTITFPANRSNTMMAEIEEQVDIFDNFVPNTMFDEGVSITDIRHAVNSDVLHIVGCGSSYIAGLMAKQLSHYGPQQYAGYIPQVFYGSEYRDLPISHCGLLGISQSGETADLKDIRPGFSMLVTNNPNSSLITHIEPERKIISAEYTVRIPLNITPEYSVAATKTFTTTCVRLAELFTTGNLPTKEFALCINKLLQMNYNKFVDILAPVKNILILGNGMDNPIAQEGALKFKEVAYIHAEAMYSSEMKHGPIALIEPDMPALFLISGDKKNFSKTVANMHEIKSRGGKPICIMEKGVIAKTEFPTIIVPRISTRYFQSLLNVVVLQILACRIAEVKGINPSRPRSLAKCVTV